MTPYEQMLKFEIGMEMGLFTISDLNEFLSARLKEQDVPYIYTDVFLSLPKGYDAVIEAIFYNLRGNYIVDRNPYNTVQRMLIGEIQHKYQSGAIDISECVSYLHMLTNHSECSWELLSIDEYYRLTHSGFHSPEEFDSILNQIFSHAI